MKDKIPHFVQNDMLLTLDFDPWLGLANEGEEEAAFLLYAFCHASGGQRHLPCFNFLSIEPH